MSLRKQRDGSYLLVRPTPELIRKYDAEMVRVKGDYRWFPKDNFQDIKKFPYHDCNFYIVGKGPSLDNLKKQHFDRVSPVFCINEAILKIQTLKLDNSIYLIQQDVSLGELNTKEPILLSNNIKGFYQDNLQKYMFVPSNYSLHDSALTALCAIKIAQQFNAKHVTLYAFDASTSGNTSYAEAVGHKVHGDSSRFLKHRTQMDGALGLTPHSWVSVPKNDYYIAVCACFKNEALYIEEWIDFHLQQGVEHFYLFNNDSSDHYEYVLKRYLEAGQVTLVNLSGNPAQRRAYDYAVENFKPECKWLAFIDIDEFLYHKGSNLRAALHEYEGKNLAVHWLMFGSNGRITRTNESVLQRFTKRAHEVNPHIKTILWHNNSDYHTPHNFMSETVDENHNQVVGPLSDGTADKFAINHYGCKSKEEFAIKVERGRVDISKKRNPEELLGYDRNDEEDLYAAQLLNWKPKVTLITCTGDRPEAFKICEAMMARQTYRGAVQWIVVDDGDTPTVCTLGQEYIHRNRTEEGHTLIYNLREALPLIRGDYILFIEDDDYYSPLYIAYYTDLLAKYPLVGAIKSQYYNPFFKKYKAFQNTEHASLCQTGIRSEYLPLLEQECQNSDPIIDKRLFNKVEKAHLFFHNPPLCVGIKGLPGRKGLLLGHKDEPSFEPDPDSKIFKALLGPDTHLYDSINQLPIDRSGSDSVME